MECRKVLLAGICVLGLCGIFGRTAKVFGRDICLEAEDGLITPPMVTAKDETASGNQYVWVPEGSGDVREIAVQGGGLQFDVEIPNTGLYEVKARIKAPSGADNSFFVSIDGNKKEWQFPESSQWQWVDYQKAIRLKKGSHTLIFSQREDGTAIDQVKIVSFQAFTPGLTKKRHVKPPFEMPKIRDPKFPKRTFNIVDYGAVADGETKNTEPFAKAIDACFKAGGGTVLVPEGQWYTGPIRLKSNINLHLAEGSEIVFSDDFQDYLPVVLTRWAGVECYNYQPLIDVRDCYNVALTGKGNIDGNGEKWWAWRTSWREVERKLIKMGDENVPVNQRIFGVEGGLRPQLFHTFNSKNILLEGVSFIGGGPFWTTDFIYSENIICRGLTIINWGPNNDGINPDSSKNMIIEDCYFQTADDAVAIKSGRNVDGRRIGISSENIIVRNCQSVNSVWGTVSIGSEMSGGVKNVFVHDCYFDYGHSCFFFKTTRQRGGVVENVWIQDIEFKNTTQRVFSFTMHYPDWSESVSPGPGIFRDIHIKNMKGSCIQGGLSVTGLEDYPFANVTIENLEFSGKWGAKLTNVGNFKLKNVCVHPREGTAFEINSSKDVEIEPGCPDEVNVLADIKGDSTKNIFITMPKDWDGRNAIILGSDVSEDAVRINSGEGTIITAKQPEQPKAENPSKSDYCFENIHPYYLQFDIPSLIHIHSKEDVETTRASVIDYLWKQPILPDKQPASVKRLAEPDVPDWIKVFNDKGLAAVDKLDIKMDYDMHSYAYLLHPENPVNRFLVFQMGHGGSILGYGGQQTIEHFLGKGFTVMTFWMPLFAENSRIVRNVPEHGDFTFGLNQHDKMSEILENDEGSFIRFFLEPVIVGINYMEKEYQPDDIWMTGVSGGGWTTHVCAAIDPRIRMSFPVAGALPLYLRYGPCHNGSKGDAEQIYPALYEDVASWLDIFILGSYGKDRAQYHILNQYDACCFGGPNYQTYESQLRQVIDQLGRGHYEVVLDSSHRKHTISDHVIETVYAPMIQN